MRLASLALSYTYTCTYTYIFWPSDYTVVWHDLYDLLIAEALHETAPLHPPGTNVAYISVCIRSDTIMQRRGQLFSLNVIPTTLGWHHRTLYLFSHFNLQVYTLIENRTLSYTFQISRSKSQQPILLTHLHSLISLDPAA